MTSCSPVRRLLAVLLCACPAAALADPGELVMLAPLNHTMPFARFEKGELRGGILHDMGMALGKRLERRVRFVAAPSRRVGILLASGDADGVCMVRPGWIDGELHWSPPLIPTGGVVLARRDAPRLRSLRDLHGQKVGTVAGYRYQVAGKTLGDGFVRDDAPSGEHTLRKVLAGRTRYALMETNVAAWHVRSDATGSLRLDFVYEMGMAQCAFSPRSAIPWPQLLRATTAMANERSMDKIMARYR